MQVKSREFVSDSDGSESDDDSTKCNRPAAAQKVFNATA